MLQGLALIFLGGMALGRLSSRLRLPPLLGMLLAGILLGPHVLGLLDERILLLSSDLRRIALLIILTRAGLNLRLEDLRRVGRPALLMCFRPACFELVGMVLLAPKLLGVRPLEAALLGSVVAAVSPAVIIPKMLRLIEDGWGGARRIPQMIMAGASVDDVFVIVLFTSLTGLAAGESLAFSDLARIPVSILLGIAAGLLCGSLLAVLYHRVPIRDTAKVVLLLSLSFLLAALEDRLSGRVGFSSLLAVMAAGVALQMRQRETAARLSARYAKLWVAAEPLLFVLVGATVNIRCALDFGPVAVLLLFLVLLFRMLGVWVCLLGTALDRRHLVCRNRRHPAQLCRKECIFGLFCPCAAQTLEQIPGAAIRDFQLSGQLCCRDTSLIPCHQIHGPEPHSQRQMCTMHNCASRD